jgi:hypothetical protein
VDHDYAETDGRISSGEIVTGDAESLVRNDRYYPKEETSSGACDVVLHCDQQTVTRTPSPVDKVK